MNCTEARKLVHLFVDDALDPRANVDVLAHLNMCPPCSERFAEARRFEDFLCERLKPGPAPEGVRMRIELRLAEMTAPWPIRLAGRLRRRPVALMGSVAATLMISLAAWSAFGVWSTCPYVRGGVANYEKIQAGLCPLTFPTTGPAAEQIKAYPPPPAMAGLHFTGAGMVELSTVYRDAVAYAYRTEHCPPGAKCCILFLVNAPALKMGDHNTVTLNGQTFTRWEYNDCRVVAWKDEKHGLYCLMVCKNHEMEPDALLNVASLADLQ